MMMREDCEKGFFVSFDYSSDALQEIESFFKRSHKVIVTLTVKEILTGRLRRNWVTSSLTQPSSQGEGFHILRVFEKPVAGLAGRSKTQTASCMTQDAVTVWKSNYCLKRRTTKPKPDKAAPNIIAAEPPSGTELLFGSKKS